MSYSSSINVVPWKIPRGNHEAGLLIFFSSPWSETVKFVHGIMVLKQLLIVPERRVLPSSFPSSASLLLLGPEGRYYLHLFR